MDLAVLGLEIRSDTVPVAGKRLDDFERQAVRTDRTADRVAKTIGRMAAQFAALAAVTFSFNTMIREARAFDAALAEVSTLLPVVEGEIDAIAEASRRMSREFGTTAASQAQAFYQAISAGAGDAAQATELLEVANRTAIGGITDVTVAVDILTTATNAYAASGLTASDAADTLFVGMRAGKTTIDELASTLGRVIPQATAVGLSFDEIVAATAALTTQGQSTEMAVTGLSGIMTQLLKPSSQAVDLAKELGIEFSATAAQTMGLAGFMEYLVEATGGSQEALAMLFGSTEALRAVFSLAGQGGEKFNDILGDMEERAGAADEAFNRVSESLDQRLNVVMARFGDIALAGGQVLLTVIVPAMEAAASAAEGFSSAAGFLGQNIERVLTYAATFAAFWAGPYVAAMVGAQVATFSFSGALVALRGALIRTGIGALVVLAGELVFQLVRMARESEAFGDAMEWVGGVFRSVGNIGVDVFRRISAGGQAMDATMRAVAYGIQAAFLGVFGSIYEAYANMVNGMNAGLRLFGIEQSDLDPKAATAGFNHATSEMQRYGEMAGNLWGRVLAPVEENTPGAPAGRGRPGGPASSIPSTMDVGGAGGSLGGLGGGGGAEAQLNAYQEATQAVRDNIEALERQQQAFGLSETAAARFNTAMDLLKGAQEAGIPITDELIGEINGLANAYAVAEEAGRRMTEQQQFMEQVQSTVSSGFADLFKGIITGSKSAIQSIGDLLGRLGDLLLNRGFELLFSGFGGGMGGGGLLGGMIIPGILHSGGVAGADGYGHGRAFAASTWAGAQRYHNGGIAGLRPNEVPAILERGERVVPANQNGGTGGTIKIELGWSQDSDGNIAPVIKRVANDTATRVVSSAAPAMVATATKQANTTAPGAVARYQRDVQGGDWR